MVQISRHTPNIEVTVHDALEWFEVLRREWEEQDFFDYNNMDLEEIFDCNIYSWYEEYIYGMSSVNDCEWNGEDFGFSVEGDNVDNVEAAIQKITKISDFSDVVAFVLDNEDGFYCITARDDDGEILGTLPFESDEEDEDEEDEDEEESSENDFVDFLSPPVASSTCGTGYIQPPVVSRRIGQYEQAAIHALAWLGNKFQTKTEDRRTQ
jgi:hypothetical protein